MYLHPDTEHVVRHEARVYRDGGWTSVRHPAQGILFLYNKAMQSELIRTTRGRLIHFDGPGVPQFVTWRCADSIPQSEFNALMEATNHLPRAERNRQLASGIEKLQDRGLGTCPLLLSRQGKIMKERLLAHDGEFYDLHAWVIMPNHVHILISPLEQVMLATIMKRIKGASSRFINEARGVRGSLGKASTLVASCAMKATWRRSRTTSTGTL